jgi:hypothetical protein
VYVIGGKFAYNICEKYFVADDVFEYFAELNLGRHNPSAVLFGDSIFAIGGFPLEKVG